MPHFQVPIPDNATVMTTSAFRYNKVHTVIDVNLEDCSPKEKLEVGMVFSRLGESITREASREIYPPEVAGEAATT